MFRHGRTTTATRPWFAEITPTLELRGFGCTAVPPGGGGIRWAVSRMNGDPVPTPNSRDVPLLPYVPSSTPRWSMTTADGLPLRTTGTVVVRAGTKVVARQRLGAAVRRLVFGAPWNGRVGGAFRPGVYTAVLTLRDPFGRTVTAQQQVFVVRSGAAPCSS